MVTVYEVKADKLIRRLADKLKEMGLKKPVFVDYVKTGAHVERPPEQENFWYIRSASILRKLYINNILGVNKLRKMYGKRVNRGVKPEKKRKAGGKIIRVALQELEQLGLVEKTDKGGRRLTPKGISLLDNISKEVSS